jgi:hypothetical protein
MDTFADSTHFLIVTTNTGDVEKPYQFIAQMIEDGLVYSRVELKDTLAAGDFARFPLILELDENGKLTIELGTANRRIEGSIKE